MELSLQEKYAAKSICFGCGPANQKGLQIRSYVQGEAVVAKWTAQKFHEAFPGMLNGGIIGSLLDCHCNWTAAWTLKEKNGLETTPCTVTAEYTIKLMRPTPSDAEIELVAKPIEIILPDRVWVEGELRAKGKVTATCRGLFVAVKENHPAFHRW